MYFIERVQVINKEAGNGPLKILNILCRLSIVTTKLEDQSLNQAISDLYSDRLLAIHCKEKTKIY